jgi:hypothetical protein
MSFFELVKLLVWNLFELHREIFASGIDAIKVFHIFSFFNRFPSSCVLFGFWRKNNLRDSGPMTLFLWRIKPHHGGVKLRHVFKEILQIVLRRLNVFFVFELRFHSRNYKLGFDGIESFTLSSLGLFNLILILLHNFK